MCFCGEARLVTARVVCLECVQGANSAKYACPESSIFTCQGLFDVSVLVKASVVTEWAAVSSSKADRTAAVPPP